MFLTLNPLIHYDEKRLFLLLFLIERPFLEIATAQIVGPSLVNCGNNWEMVGWHAIKELTILIVGPIEKKFVGPLLGGIMRSNRRPLLANGLLVHD